MLTVKITGWDSWSLVLELAGRKLTFSCDNETKKYREAIGMMVESKSGVGR